MRGGGGEGGGVNWPPPLEKTTLKKASPRIFELEYLSHLYWNFWYKSNKLRTCSVAKEKCYKWHKMNSENNATNDQSGP